MQRKIQVNKDQYVWKYENTQKRWSDYYEQLKVLAYLSKKYNEKEQETKILEIGVGTKFLQINAKRIGLNIQSVDYDKELNPDYVGDITNIPIKNEKYHIVCAFEVLEHIPFNEFSIALNEMKRISKKYVVFSVPYAALKFHLSFKILPHSEIKTYEAHFPLFFLKHKFNGEHYWEMCKRGYSKNKIVKIIQGENLKIVKTWIPQRTYHIFFILEK